MAFGGTESSDFLFEPKVWSDHIRAYFDQKLVYGAFAIRDNTLQAEGSGLTINFPYYSKIGAAEEPLETAALTPDALTDDSFNATVKEVGKAVSFTKKSFKKSADSMAGIMAEAQRQMARVHAEKVDGDLNTEITAVANIEDGTPAVVPAKMSISVLNAARMTAFGDKFQEAEVCFMHSRVYLDMINDSGSGFLKADANDPMAWVEGFMGRFLGMAIVVVDTTPNGVDANAGTAAGEYLTHFHKADSYGLMMKQDIELDDDKDVLTREIVVTSNEWYAVKSFHKEIASDYLRAGGVKTLVSA
jgi:hypothetical protein